eukprot:5694848-Amphidinium_carterae.1
MGHLSRLSLGLKPRLFQYAEVPLVREMAAESLKMSPKGRITRSLVEQSTRIPRVDERRAALVAKDLGETVIAINSESKHIGEVLQGVGCNPRWKSKFDHAEKIDVPLAVEVLVVKRTV